MPEHFHRRGHHVQKAHGRRVHLASDGSHLSGGMIALMPTPEDAKRLALPGGEKAADLHCTLFFLGDDGSVWTEDQRNELEGLVRAMSFGLTPVKANVFGAAHWNGNGDKPSWVWSVGDSPDQGLADSHLNEVRYAVTDALESTHERPELPQQHSPWVAHICAAYTDDLTLLRTLEKRLGPVTFDRIRLSFGDDDRDIPLTATAVNLTASALRREPTEAEAYCDFAEHNRQWEGAVASVSGRMAAVYAGWRAQLRGQIVSLADEPLDLTALTVTPGDASDILSEAMTGLARQAGQSLQKEAEKQGVNVPDWELPDDVVTAAVGGRRLLDSVARMTADLMATSVVQTAKRTLTGLFTRNAPPEEIAQEVDRALADAEESLTRGPVATAMSTAQTAGRQAVLEAAPPGEYYASEILDKNTCVAPEARITTDRGTIPASDVSLEDRLLTHTGQWVKPSRIVVSEIREPLVRVGLSEGRSLRLTWDHPVFIWTGSGFLWRNAGDLAVGDLVVSQPALQLGREHGSIDRILGETPYGVAPADEVSRFPAVNLRPEAVPVRAVSFEDQSVAHQEVDHPRADLGLTTIDIPQAFEGLTDTALDSRLCTTCPVAADGAVPLTGHGGRDDAERHVAVCTGDGDGRATACLRTVLAGSHAAVTERRPATVALRTPPPGFGAAFSGAVGVPVRVGEGDFEQDRTVRAGLGHPIPCRANPGSDLRVSELTLNRAVDSAVAPPPRDLTFAGFAGRRRVVRTTETPGPAHRAGLAQRASSDLRPAVRTQLVHNFSVQVEEVRSLDRESYSGEVYDFTVPGDETFWAQGVLLHNCSPCKAVDGEQFGDLERAIKAYPVMGYKDCVGSRYGNSCRGMIVARWTPEEAQTASAATIPSETHLTGEGTVPWHKVHNHSGCASGEWAVVKDSDGSVAGCHGSEAGADEQLAALYASEGDATVTTEALKKGDPSKGTKKDRRLAENQYADEGHFGPSHSVSSDPWNGSASAFTDEQYKRSCAACDSGKGTTKELCFLPHHNPGGSLNRAGLGAAAGRIGSLSGHSPEAVAKAKAHLRSHYRALGEDAPASLAATSLERQVFGVEADYGLTRFAPDCPPGMKHDMETGKCVKDGVEDEVPVDTMASESLEMTGATAPWRGPLTVEGIETGDGREFESGSLTWADLPLPLRWNIEDSHGGEPRTKAVNVGRIDSIWREDSGLIMGEGVLDLSDDNGQKAYGKIEGKFLRGVSVDVDSIKDADMELVWADTDPDGEGEPDPFAQLFASPEKVVFRKGRIRAATLVDIPAFAEAYIALLDQDGAVVAGGEPVGALRQTHVVRARTSSVTRTSPTPPADWFTNPDLSVPTPVTVTPDGRVYGHAALWGTCHIGQTGVCVTPPHEDDHPYFMTGAVACQDAVMASVGQITVGTGHAPLHLGHRAASEHYDNTGAAVADVTVGNDAHGIWLAGCVRPGAAPDRVHELRASGQVSGDWRRIGGQLRLVGLLAVNVPGFPVPKLATKYTLGHQLSLVAAGAPDLVEHLTEDDLDQIAYRRIMNKLNARVHGER